MRLCHNNFFDTAAIIFRVIGDQNIHLNVAMTSNGRSE